eukprot:m.22843 g.22843  ORF g.22843 m.22843 type:complete len:123 (+) comp9382_c0_seq2:97-465(+)
MDQVIGHAEEIAETLRQAALSMVTDAQTSAAELPDRLEQLVRQYQELTEARLSLPDSIVPFQLIKLVDEGHAPSAFVEEQLKQAQTNATAAVASSRALKALHNELEELLSPVTAEDNAAKPS